MASLLAAFMVEKRLLFRPRLVESEVGWANAGIPYRGSLSPVRQKFSPPHI